MTIFGYMYRMKMAHTPREEPSLPLALVTLIIGVLYLVISLLYLSAWMAQQKRKKHSKNDREKKNQESV
jgi:preprotein translocase subunit SecG